MKNKKTIGLLDGHTIQSLCVSKALKKLGHFVISFCENKNSYGYHSTYTDKKIISPKSNIIEYKNFIIHECKKNKIDIVIPMNDDSAFFLSRHQNELKKHVDFITQDEDVFLSAYDKLRLMKLCKKYNFPHPKTFEQKEINSTNINIEYPCIIKPNQTTGSRGFEIAINLDELISKSNYVKKNYGNCHIQEFIPSGGNQYKVQLFIQNKKLINSTVIKKIRYYPIKGGSSTFIKTIFNKELIYLCKSITEKIGWEGFVDFDLIEDPRDKIIKVMEINPRIPACIKVAQNSGVNFIKNIFDGSINKKTDTYDYKYGNYLKYIALDFLAIKSSDKSNIKYINWAVEFFKRRMSYQDFELREIKAFFWGTINGISKKRNKKFMQKKSKMN